MSDDMEDMFLPEPAVATAAAKPWTILIVDDDADVHTSTGFVASKFKISQRGVQFLHAYSAKEAEELLLRTDNLALIFLDVVMESDTAGLDLVPVIRRMPHLQTTQIVLRTGQAGYHPEVDVIANYDLNGYLVKSEITESKLYSVFNTSIRAYESLTRQENARLAVEGLLAENSRYLGTTRFRGFAEHFLHQVADSLGIPAHGLVCAKILASDTDRMIQGATGPYEPLIGQSLTELEAVDIRARLDTCLQTGQSTIDPFEIVLYLPGPRAYGAAIYLLGTGTPPTIDPHLVAIYSNNFAVCAENMALIADLSQLNKVDALLSIPNQTALISVIDKRLENFPRAATMVAALKISMFNEFCSAHGAPLGDSLLYAISERLRSQINPNCTIGRIAESSFAIVSDIDWMHPQALEKIFREPFLIEDKSIAVECAMGVAYAPDTVGRGADLLRNARFAATYAASVNQGGMVVYKPDFDHDASKRAEIVRELRAAISEKQLYVTYQPRIHLASGNVVAFEAILRWQRPDGTHVPTDRFLPFVEQSGSIGNLGIFVLDAALQALTALRKLGHTGQRMSLRISTSQLKAVGFLQSIESALKETGTQPNDLELEIADAIAAFDKAEFMAQLQAMRDKGIAIALDDFGSGYSAVSHLEQIPADRIKIDRSMVWALESQQPAKRIVEMVIHLARQMNMKVLATGVDTQQQADILSNHNGDEAQGYLYAQPLKLEELIEWLAARGLPDG